MPAPVAIGEKITFTPQAFTTDRITAGKTEIRKSVTGRVVYINRPHRYFTVEYEAGGKMLKESFKF